MKFIPKQIEHLVYKKTLNINTLKLLNFLSTTEQYDDIKYLKYGFIEGFILAFPKVVTTYPDRFSTLNLSKIYTINDCTFIVCAHNEKDLDWLIDNAMINTTSEIRNTKFYNLIDKYKGA